MFVSKGVTFAAFSDCPLGGIKYFWRHIVESIDWKKQQPLKMTILIFFIVCLFLAFITLFAISYVILFKHNVKLKAVSLIDKIFVFSFFYEWARESKSVKYIWLSRINFIINMLVFLVIVIAIGFLTISLFK